MKNLTKVTLIIALFAVSGCGDDQADQASQRGQAAPPAADTQVTSTETTVELSYPKPPWAVLEQDVYFYPD